MNGGGGGGGRGGGRGRLPPPPPKPMLETGLLRGALPSTPRWVMIVCSNKGCKIHTSRKCTPLSESSPTLQPKEK